MIPRSTMLGFTRRPTKRFESLTLIPGFSLYDFRDTVSSAYENQRGLSKTAVRLPIFEAFVRGPLDGCACLCDSEVESMAFAGRLISLETGIKVDHLTPK